MFRRSVVESRPWTLFSCFNPTGTLVTRWVTSETPLLKELDESVFYKMSLDPDDSSEYVLYQLRPHSLSIQEFLFLYVT